MIKSIVGRVRNVSRKFFLKRILQSISALPNGGFITLVDIGAAGDIEPRWKPFTKFLNYVGFEPDERSRKDLLSKGNGNTFHDYSIFPFAVGGSKNELSFNLCRKPQVSSTYVPNFDFLKNFPEVERFEVVSTETIPVVPMDSLNINNPDFMKIDIQGGELNALLGAEGLLSDVLGLELEVEFVELYSTQPLFGNVCEFLYEKGFEFIDFVNLCRWERDKHNGFGQCVFGDALFLRTPEKLDYTNISLDKISSYLSILLIYRRYDLIDKTLPLLPEVDRHKFELFEKKVSKARIVDKLARKIVGINSRLISLLGSDYRTHLIY
jgi:FkbM family methyltransferase